MGFEFLNLSFPEVGAVCIYEIQKDKKKNGTSANADPVFYSVIYKLTLMECRAFEHCSLRISSICPYFQYRHFASLSVP